MGLTVMSAFGVMGLMADTDVNWIDIVIYDGLTMMSTLAVMGLTVVLTRMLIGLTLLSTMTLMVVLTLGVMGLTVMSTFGVMGLTADTDVNWIDIVIDDGLTVVCRHIM